MKLKEKIFYSFFQIFNVMLGLVGLGIVAIGIMFSIDIKKFNGFSFLLIIIGLTVVLFVVLGIFTKNRKCLLEIYLFFIFIIMAGFAALGIMVKFFKDKLIDIIKKKMEDIIDSLKKKIDDYNLIIAIVCCSIGLLCLIILIFACLYHGELSKRYRKRAKDMNEGDDILRKLDYSGDALNDNSLTSN